VFDTFIILLFSLHSTTLRHLRKRTAYCQPINKNGRCYWPARAASSLPSGDRFASYGWCRLSRWSLTRRAFTWLSSNTLFLEFRTHELTATRRNTQGYQGKQQLNCVYRCPLTYFHQPSVLCTLKGGSNSRTSSRSCDLRIHVIFQSYKELLKIMPLTCWAHYAVTIIVDISWSMSVAVMLWVTWLRSKIACKV